MNAYLRSARNRYAALRQEIQQAQTRADREDRDLTEDELAAITRSAAEAHELARGIQEMQEHERNEQANNATAAQLRADEGQGQGLGHHPDPYADLGGGLEPVPALMPTRDQVAELYRAAHGQTALRVQVDQDGRHHRAAVMLANTGTPEVSLDRVDLPEPRRLATAAGLLTQRVQGTPGVTFPMFGAGTAELAAEGATKTEYAAITPGTATPQVIAVWTDASRQALETVASFEGRLRQKHAALVAKREDLLLVTTVQAAAGTLTHAPAATQGYADSLLHAAALVADSGVGAPPDLAVVNPADVVAIFGGDAALGLAGERPSNDLRLSLHGMTVYPSSAVAAGSALVGAWRASSRFVVGMPPTVLVDAVSGLKTNRITILLEEAAALAVEEPTGFCEVTFNDGVA